MNPNPAGQLQFNRPTLNGIQLRGVQHKYRDILLFFPSAGQTCHSYCTYCFRWPQFVGWKEQKLSGTTLPLLRQYLLHHPEVTDILLTGGDPLIMRTSAIENIVSLLLDIDTVATIRFGTKALSYWQRWFGRDRSNNPKGIVKLTIGSP